MKSYIKLLRPHHYIKNFLLFLPLVFSGNVFNTSKLIPTMFAFLAFSMAASFVYIINDIKDKERDKKHAVKKYRPIASGEISVFKAILFASFILLLSFGFQFLIGKETLSSFLYILVYIFINLCYSFGLKNIPLLDVTIIVFGFLLRVLYGGSVINIEVSNWLYLTIISLSFYLALGKRRNEIIKSGTKSRKVLQYYNKEFLDKNMYMCLAISIVFYSLWCVNNSLTITNNLLIWSIPLVMLILMKYSMDVENDNFGDPVDVVVNDNVLIVLILIYGIFMFSILYILK